MNKKFVNFMEQYLDAKMAVGVSGGIDSMCLLYWLHQIGADVVCLHVNHKLRAEADVETDYVANVCKQLNIPCQIFYWDDKKPEKGLVGKGAISAIRNGCYNLAVYIKRYMSVLTR